jgi:hypothetical protein
MATKVYSHNLEGKISYMYRTILLIGLLIQANIVLAQISNEYRQKDSFELIKKDQKNIYEQSSSVGDINQQDIRRLSEPLLALAAYYCGFGGSECGNNDSCKLTISLGLGKQGSRKQVELIQKWLGNDSAAKILIKQKCYQPPDGASIFSNYIYFNFKLQGNIVTVNYLLINYDHGKYYSIRGPDIYKIKNNHIEVVKRNIWSDLVIKN